MDSWHFYKCSGRMGIVGKMSNGGEIGAEEKERNGDSREKFSLRRKERRISFFPGEKRWAVRKGRVMNRTGHRTFCSPHNPLCSKPDKYTLNLGSASLTPSWTGLWSLLSAFSAFHFHSGSQKLQPQTRPWAIRFLLFISSQISDTHQNNISF